MKAVGLDFFKIYQQMNGRFEEMKEFPVKGTED